ncbi:amidohydrolase family protein [Aestuariibius sp. 2305UL40-4]|uniref:amidohydrolase family protein n=1 Tax=Aestuariibius violaceus TaxID=3234132 RepID=UPI00345EF5E4
MPLRAVDAHAHMVATDFALAPSAVERPPDWDLGEALTAYRKHLERLGFSRGVLVHSILYGTDNSVTVEALRQLGPSFAGIGLVSDDVDEEVLDRFVEWRLRGVRLNLVHGSLLSWPAARRLAPALAERGLHVEMLLHTHEHLAEIAEDIQAMPVPVVIDHLGWPDVARGVEEPGFQTLLRLISDGHAYVKLSAVYRFSSAPYDDVIPLVSALAEAAPERCLWGSDWPHLMLGNAGKPEAARLFDAFYDAVPSEAARRTILVTAPEALYGLNKR